MILHVMYMHVEGCSELYHKFKVFNRRSPKMRLHNFFIKRFIRYVQNEAPLLHNQ